MMKVKLTPENTIATLSVTGLEPASNLIINRSVYKYKLTISVTNSKNVIKKCLVASTSIHTETMGFPLFLFTHVSFYSY